VPPSLGKKAADTLPAAELRGCAAHLLNHRPERANPRAERLEAGWSPNTVDNEPILVSHLFNTARRE
jgi:hypothetical protein